MSTSSFPLQLSLENCVHAGLTPACGDTVSQLILLSKRSEPCLRVHSVYASGLSYLLHISAIHHFPYPPKLKLLQALHHLPPTLRVAFPPRPSELCCIDAPAKGVNTTEKFLLIQLQDFCMHPEMWDWCESHFPKTSVSMLSYSRHLLNLFKTYWPSVR